MARTTPPVRPLRLLPALALVVAALAAAASAVPEGSVPALDRARERASAGAGRAIDAAKSAAGVDTAAPDAGGLRTVVRCVDGDTVVLDGNEKVRLIGVNTPESVDPRRPVQWFGKEAAAYARSLLQGRRVRLEHDVEGKDRYGRTLAYLRLEDGTFVNLRLVEEGYAFAYRHPPNVRYAERFRDAERRAREAGKGLWSDPGKAKSLAPTRR
jgi:micrococcal nuclease